MEDKIKRIDIKEFREKVIFKNLTCKVLPKVAIKTQNL